MLRRTYSATLMALALAYTASAACAATKGCKLAKLAELPVTMASGSPLVRAKINGADALFLTDSGAFYSLISPGSAAQFKLKESPAPYHLTLHGIGGSQEARVTTVREFMLAGIPLHRVEFIVGGSETGGGAAGLIGQNVLRIADVEYDLANGAIRLMRPEGCRSANLAYWAKTGQIYSVMDIGDATAQEPDIAGIGYLNGAKIRVVFDTGSQVSMLTLHAAERAGIKPDSPGVVPAGNFQGIGRAYVKTWLAPFQTFKIGDEEIRNTRLRLGDVGLENADMLLGDDFFLSHRVYVASSQGKLYFTYNGGPVFNLKTVDTQHVAAGATPEQPPVDQSLDAEGLERRGAAFAARHEYGPAIAYLSQACQLAPRETRYLFELANVLVEDGQFDAARENLGRLLELKADDVQALVMRAKLRLMSANESAAVADLDAADHAAAQQDDARLAMGHLYARSHRMPQASAQYDRWIDAHPDDVRLAGAYISRCSSRAASGELERALSDCNKANRLSAHNARFLQVRGLLQLRLGEYDHAISDFDASLKLDPKNAWCLYGRGQAEQHKQKKAAADDDFAAATALQPHIAEQFRASGFAAPE